MTNKSIITSKKLKYGYILFIEYYSPLSGMADISSLVEKRNHYYMHYKYISLIGNKLLIYFLILLGLHGSRVLKVLEERVQKAKINAASIKRLCDLDT